MKTEITIVPECGIDVSHFHKPTRPQHKKKTEKGKQEKMRHGTLLIVLLLGVPMIGVAG